MCGTNVCWILLILCGIYSTADEANIFQRYVRLDVVVESRSESICLEEFYACKVEHTFATFANGLFVGATQFTCGRRCFDV